MKQIGNIITYTDDIEIVEVLQKIPPLEELGYKTVLQHLEENTIGRDFGGIIPFNGDIYTIYKFGSTNPKLKDDVGLTMTVSKTKYAKEQLGFWYQMSQNGVTFRPKVFDTIIAGLMACLFHSGGK